MKGKKNLDKTEESTGKGNFPLVPAGVYNVNIYDYQEKRTKTNDDPMISIYMEILDGEYKGRKLFDMIVLPGEGSPAEAI